ncbi:MAG: hypothetical protein ACRDRH_00405 [Pseudonocardia sp.]
MTAGCDSHPGFSHELRSLALTALDRLDPVLDQVRAEPVAGTPSVAGTQSAERPCAFCPVCEVISALRGERSELAVRLAEQAAGLAAVLRAALEDGGGGPVPGGRDGGGGPVPDNRDGGGPVSAGQGGAAAERGKGASTRAVQHIPVSR